NGAAESEIEKIIREAAEKSDEFDRRMLSADGGAAVPLKDNEQLQIMMAAEIDNTHGLCRNYTGTLGFAEVNATGNVVYSSMTDFLRKQMDMAHMKVASGVTDYNTAVRQACRALSDSGLRTVYYESGRSDRIEVAVRRALMTSVSQVTQRISEQNAEEFGADGWEISAHAGARPSHAIYQGRQFPNSQYETIVRPLIEDYNCRHSAFPIIMGVSQPAYTEEELTNIDPPPFTYEGRTYTAYQAQQQMRKMERAMRKQKDRCIAADAAGDKDTFTAASIKLRRQKDIYEDFCKTAGTYTEYERTFVQGYDRHLAGKTGAVTRSQNRQKNLQITLTDLEKGGIIKAGSDKVALEYQRYGRNKSTLVNKTYIDSGEYRRKFDRLTDNPEVNRTIYSKAKEMLKHRSGTKIEDMYWIDGDTGEIVASALNEKGESSVRYTEAIHKAIIGRKNLIAMHTHPQSLPPSDADFNSVVRYGYSKALVLCHDGKIFQYTANETINGALYDAYVQRFSNEGLSQFDAQIKALKKISENCDIDFGEVE
ncbi:MAG: phage minor capsid protein, partial [Oscillospiraceae bacterium]|nr:phage minor capsid protein [Oscillospiraceae bacterium]